MDITTVLLSIQSLDNNPRDHGSKKNVGLMKNYIIKLLPTIITFN